MSFTRRLQIFATYALMSQSAYMVFGQNMIPTISSFAYADANNGLASLLDKVSKNSEIVIINRRNKPDIALIAKEELDSLLETVYLLRSSANARDLFQAIEESKQMDKAKVEP